MRKKIVRILGLVIASIMVLSFFAPTDAQASEGTRYVFWVDARVNEDSITDNDSFTISGTDHSWLDQWLNAEFALYRNGTRMDIPVWGWVDDSFQQVGSTSTGTNYSSTVLAESGNYAIRVLNVWSETYEGNGSFQFYTGLIPIEFEYDEKDGEFFGVVDVTANYVPGDEEEVEAEEPEEEIEEVEETIQPTQLAQATNGIIPNIEIRLFGPNGRVGNYTVTLTDVLELYTTVEWLDEDPITVISMEPTGTITFNQSFSFSNWHVNDTIDIVDRNVIGGVPIPVSDFPNGFMITLRTDIDGNVRFATRSDLENPPEDYAPFSNIVFVPNTDYVDIGAGRTGRLTNHQVEGGAPTTFLPPPQPVNEPPAYEPPVFDTPVYEPPVYEPIVPIAYEPIVPITAPIGTKYVSAYMLNQRSGPGMNNRIVGVLNRNEAVTVLGETRGWINVYTRHGEGYVFNRYLTDVVPATVQTPATVAPAPVTPFVSSAMFVSPPFLNMRSGPGNNQSIITVLPRGTAVTVIGESHGWRNVQTAQGEGWVFYTFLTNERPEAYVPADNLSAPNPAFPYTMFVSPSFLNMRSGPGNDQSIITVLPRGTAVTVIGNSHGWRNVQTEQGEGWVFYTFLTQERPDVVAPAAPATPTAPHAMYVGAYFLNMRSGPGNNYRIISVLPLATPVTVIGEDRGWQNVQTEQGTGWVFNTFLVTERGAISPATATARPVAATPRPETAAPAGGAAATNVTSPFFALVTDVDNLNLRTGPASGNDLVGTLPRGTVVTVVASSGNWYQVETHIGSGWVHGRYVTSDF